MNYLVSWIIEVEADSPLEAAEECFRIMQDPDSLATCYSVHPENEPTQITSVDLRFDEQHAVITNPDGSISYAGI